MGQLVHMSNADLLEANARRLGTRSGPAFEVSRRPTNPLVETAKFLACIAIPLAAVVVAHLIIGG